MVVYLTHAREIRLVTSIRNFEDLVFSVISFPLCHVPAFLSGAKSRQTKEQSMFLLARGILLSLILFPRWRKLYRIFFGYPTSQVCLFVVCFYYCCKLHFVCEWGVKRDKPTSSKPPASESSGHTQAKVNKLVSSSWFVLWLACGTPVFFRLWNVCALLVFLMDFLLVASFLFLCKLACGWLVAGL